MSESTLPSESAETFEETLSEYLDTALPDTHEQDGPDSDTADAGPELGQGDTE